MVLAAFAALVPDNVLRLAPRGMLNVHPSLLPRWRGAAPIQSALLAGDHETGVSIMRLVEALDAGPIFAQARVPIAAEDDYLSLEPRLATLGAELLVQTLADWPEPWAQPEAGVTFSRRLEREDGRIDWTRPAVAIWQQVRALRAWPRAFTFFDGQTLAVLRATPSSDDASGAAAGTVQGGDVPRVATGAGWLQLDEVQLEGRRAQSGAEFLRGYARVVGGVLGRGMA
jgi:methionyl-tRNA formyltransferase